MLDWSFFGMSPAYVAHDHEFESVMKINGIIKHPLFHAPPMWLLDEDWHVLDGIECEMVETERGEC